MKQADLRDAIIRDQGHAIRMLQEDMTNAMTVISMLTNAARDLNERLVKLETGRTDDFELEVADGQGN